MKFSPETLLRIYLDGSFTEEAQAEFDALMRKDPDFAEKVTQAVSERLGPVPDASVEAIASRLDAKVQDLWAKHKPSPWVRPLRLGLKALTALSLAAAGVWSFHHWAAMSPISISPQDRVRTTVSPAKATKDQGPSTIKIGSKRHPAVKPSSREDAAEEQVGTQDDGTEAKVRTVDALKSQAQGDKAPVVATAPKTKASMTSALGNTLRVAIPAHEPGAATITVYDANGGLVRHLFQGPVGTGDNYVDWDGKDDMGSALMPGSYYVVLDLNGKKMSSVLKILPK